MQIECEDTGEIVYSYPAYLNTNHWDLKKQELAISLGPLVPRCKLCKKEGKLSVHHKTYKRIGREMCTDLIYLCQPCHTALHGIMTRMKESGSFEIKNQYTEEYATMQAARKLAAKDVMRKERDHNSKAKNIIRKKAKEGQ